MTLVYAPAVQADLEPLYELNRQLIDAYEDLNSIDYPTVLAWVHRNLERNLLHFVRVLADGVLAGYYCLRPEGERMELDSLFVLPPFQNRGIGTQILKKCLLESDMPVFLYVFRKNTRAMALYGKLGFRIVKEVGKTRYFMEQDPRG
ncbi:MAG: GNAT family N-acetyltransferase [Faecousia sp.]